MNVVLFGAGGHAKVTIDIMRLNNYNVYCILDDDKSTHRTNVLGVPVLGGKEKFDEIIQNNVSKMIITIGSNKVRMLIANLAKSAGFNLVNAIHPSSVIAKSAVIGEGVFIASGAVICADARIGDCSIINTGASVDHECVIEEAAHICPGVRLAGNVSIGSCAQVGIGSSVIQGLTIGEHSMIGAGSVVVRDIPSHVTAYGAPAKVKKHHGMAMR